MALYGRHVVGPVLCAAVWVFVTPSFVPLGQPARHRCRAGSSSSSGSTDSKSSRSALLGMPSTPGRSAAAFCLAATSVLVSLMAAGVRHKQTGGAAAVTRSATGLTKNPAPMLEKKKKQRPKFVIQEQVGITAPLGFFDPLGFSKDKKSFNRYRDLELKHGRASMLASLGMVTQHFVHFVESLPVNTFIKVAPYGMGAVNTFYGFLGFGFRFGPIMVFLIWLEFAWIPSNEGKEPGDYGDPLGLNMYNTDMRNKELNNGRFAMICIMGIFAAELATGKDAVEQLGLGL
mmetsp:Transcript_87764/g.228979  ORF Transcript_87764/g.228979 Transcript_87764/m.228979 type:complete len:288 (+) Transcript_87764:89-952(+)